MPKIKENIKSYMFIKKDGIEKTKIFFVFYIFLLIFSLFCKYSLNEFRKAKQILIIFNRRTFLNGINTIWKGFF